MIRSPSTVDPFQDFPPWYSLPKDRPSLLGQGGQAAVYHVIDNRINPYTEGVIGPIAVKCYPRDMLRRDVYRLKRVKREILNHRKLCHKHIVGFREARLTRNYLFICFNYEEGGSLWDFIHAQGLPFSEAAARWVFQQLMLAVDYSHRRHVANRDIALDNILITGIDSIRGASITLCDLGFSRSKLSLEHNGKPSIVGKKGYVAPETFLHKNRRSFEIVTKGDIYACGVCLYKMLLGLNAWPSIQLHNEDVKSLEEHLAYLMKTEDEPDLQFDLYPYELSPECKSFLKRILHTNPRHRISMDEIWEDPWFCVDLPESETREYNDVTCSKEYIEECNSSLQSEVELMLKVQQAASDFTPEGHWQ